MTREEDRSRMLSELPISDLELSVRASNVLRHGLGLSTIGEMMELTPAELSRAPGCGRRCQAEILEMQRSLSPEGRLEDLIRECNESLQRVLFRVACNPEVTLRIEWAMGSTPAELEPRISVVRTEES